MMVRYTLRTAALASTCLLPLAAHAADAYGPGEDSVAATPGAQLNNQIFVGGQYQSEKSNRFGRYTGQTDNGGSAIGGFTVRGRDDASSGGTTYWELLGSDLGLTSRSVSGKYGEQGSWGVQFNYDGIPYNGSDSFHTIYDSSGKGGVPPNLQAFTANPTSLFGSNLTAVTGASGGTAWANAYQLTPFLNTQKIGTQRDVFSGTGTYLINSEWSVVGAFRHEHKDGTLENSIGFGSLGHSSNTQPCNVTATAGSLHCTNTTAAANVVAFPEPVNYDTDRYDGKLNFVTRRLQAQFSYAFMSFSDNNRSFNAIDPLPLYNTNLTATNPPFTARAAFALPPSSSEHQIRGSAAYSLTPTTQVNVNLQYALQLQNDRMPPATNDPTSVFTATQLAQLASNPGGLKGTEQNMFGNVGFTSRPLPKMDIKASYTIDNRKDDTTTQLFTRATFDQTATAQFVNTQPSSYNDQKAKLDIGYRIFSDTKATLGYIFSQKNANNGSVGGTRENTLSAKLRSEFAEGLEGSAGYAHSNRYGVGTFSRADQYGSYVYFESPRVRDEVKADLSYTPSRELSLGFNGKVTSDHYNDVSRIQNLALPAAFYTIAPGLRNNNNLNVGPDMTFMPNKALSVHLFYNFERVFYDVGQTNTISTNINNQGSTTHGKTATTDDTHTVGVSTDWHVTSKLKFGANYNFTYGNTSIDITDGASVGYVTGLHPDGTFSASDPIYKITPLPDVTSQLHTFSVHGEYQFRPNMSFWLGYTFERLIYSDWVYDYGPSLFGNALVSGELNPSYSVHVVGAAVRVKF